MIDTCVLQVFLKTCYSSKNRNKQTISSWEFYLYNTGGSVHILLYRACSQASIESKPWANLHAGNNVVFNMWVANV